MKCRNIRNLLPRFLYESIEGHDAAAVRSHLDGCEECSRELEKLKKTMSLCSYWSIEDPPPDLVPSTLSIVRDKKSPRRFQWRWWSPRLGYACAAFLMVCMTISLYCGYFLTSDNQQTILYATDQLLAGSPLSFRVVILSVREGAPLPGALVRIELQSKESGKRYRVFTGRTDKNGSIEPSLTLPDIPPGPCDLIVWAKSPKGSDRIVRPVTVTRTYRMLLSTDKPVYQPGQVIHMRILAVENGSRKTVEEGTALFEVLDPRGNKVYKKSVQVGKYGVSSADFTLAREINLGEYRIKALMGDDIAEKVVEVKRYVLPKFNVAFNPGRCTYLPSETVTGIVTGDYFFGKKVQNARVTIDLSTFDVAFHRIAHLEGKTDDKGNYSFSLSLPSYFVGHPLEKGKGLLRFDVAVIDGTGHEEKITDTLTVAQSTEEALRTGTHEKIPIVIDCIPERKSLLAGALNRLFVVTSLPGGSPLSCDVTLIVQKSAIKGHSDEYGVAEFSFVPFSSPVDIQLTARKEGEYYGSSHFSLTAEDRGEEVLLRTDRTLYKVGDDMKLSVISPRMRGTVYVDVLRDRQALLTRSLDIGAGRAELVLDLTNDMAGTLKINAYRIAATGEVIRDTRTIVVSQSEDLVVTAGADKEVYRPGEKATFTFEVKDTAGKPVAAALGLSIVDESVFALAEKHPGLEKVYLALEKELLEPKIAVCEHNCSLDMKELANGSSHAPETQRAAAVILAAVEELGEGEFYGSMYEKLDNLERTMRGFRVAGFSLLGVIILACLAWIVIKVARTERGSGVEPPLLRAIHYLLLSIFSLIAAILICADLHYYPEDYITTGSIIFMYLMMCFVPFLSVSAYIYRRNGWGALLFYLVTIAIADMALFDFLRLVDIISTYELISSSITSLSLTTGLISLFTGAIISLRSRFGPLGILAGALLLIPFVLAIFSLERHDGEAAFFYVLIITAGSFIAIGAAPRSGRSLSLRTQLLWMAGFIALVTWLLIPNFVRARAQGQLTACQSNLKNIGTALEMYSTDHKGRYPRSLSQLVPNYLKAIPTCPAAGKDTYSAGYRATTCPDTYYVCCFGSNHMKDGYPPNFPSYDSMQGLIEGLGGGMSGGGIPAGADMAKMPKEAPSTIAGIRVRQFFPETLYWNPLLITDNAGKARVEVPIADSITTWRISGMAHTGKGIIGSFTKPLRVFQDFFIDPDLPEHLTRGDIISLPVAVYNYLPRAQKIEVSLVSDSWFEVKGASRREITMKPHDVTSVPFTIRVKEVGDFRFTVTARSDSEKDAVSKLIRIDPDGREVLLTQNGTLREDFHCTVPIPEESVSGGSTILVKVYPGVTTQVLDGLEGMLAMPYG